MGQANNGDAGSTYSCGDFPPDITGNFDSRGGTSHGSVKAIGTPTPGLAPQVRSLGRCEGAFSVPRFAVEAFTYRVDSYPIDGMLVYTP